MKRILFVNNYWNTLVPVIQVLKDDPDNRIVSLFPPSKDFGEKSNLDNLEHRALDDFIDPGLRTEIKNNLIEFGEKIRRLRERFPLLESNSTKTLNCDWRLIKEDYFNFASKFICQIPVLERVFEIVKPDLVCGACEPNATTAISFRLARSKNIPTLLIQHGIYVIETMGLWRVGPGGEDLSNVDKMAIWGEISREKLIEEWGEKIDQKLVITGSPRLDFYFDLQGKSLGEEKIKFCYRFGLDHTKKLIMLGLTSKWRDMEFVIKETLEVVRQFPEWQVFLRVHPGDPLEIYKEICERVKIKVPIVRDEDIATCLRVCDVMVTTPTTGGLEALLSGKPVISFRPVWQTHLSCNYVKEGAAIEVGNGIGLKDALEYIFYREDDYKREFSHNIKKYISREIYKFDGRASERVCILIKEMMRD
jgi:hypothetical protein